MPLPDTWRCEVCIDLVPGGALVAARGDDASTPTSLAASRALLAAALPADVAPALAEFADAAARATLALRPGPRCEICQHPAAGLAMKRTVTAAGGRRRGRFVHVVCAVTSPLARFRLGGRAALDGIDTTLVALERAREAAALVPSARALACAVCGEAVCAADSLVSGVADCLVGSMHRFHASCALITGALAASA
jgi:hypothetical protein